MRRRHTTCAALALSALLPLLGACGAGGGTTTALPAGSATTAPAGDRVVYVAKSRGDRVEAWRLGTDGLFPAAAFSELAMENPRRLTLAGDILYVALADRILSLELGSDGTLPAIASGETPALTGADFHDILVGDGFLHAASAGFGRIESYPLDGAGHVGDASSTSGAGGSNTDYKSLFLNEGLLFAATPDASRIDVFRLNADGSVPTEPEDHDPIPLVGLPDDILVDGEFLFVTSGSSRNIEAYPLEDGRLAFEPSSETLTSRFYGELAMTDTHIYAAAFNAGRVDLYRRDATLGLEETSSLANTQPDPSSFPASLIIDGGLLYVGQAGLGRVDVFDLNATGEPGEFPLSSTAEDTGSMPTDIEIYRVD